MVACTPRAGVQSLDLVGEEFVSSVGAVAKSILLTGGASSSSESVGVLTKVVLESFFAFTATLGLWILTREDARAWGGTGLINVLVLVPIG